MDPRSEANTDALAGQATMEEAYGRIEDLEKELSKKSDFLKETTATLISERNELSSRLERLRAENEELCRILVSNDALAGRVVKAAEILHDAARDKRCFPTERSSLGVAIDAWFDHHWGQKENSEVSGE